MKKTNVFLGFLLIGLWVVSSTGIPLQAAIPAEERAALIALYNATNGDNWYSNGGWKTPPLHTDGFAMPGTESSWTGIIVSNDHVIEIYMYDNWLGGSIPKELENLSNLYKLNLEFNQMGGSIPKELGNLSNLVELDLEYNQFSGSIPPELGNLSNLVELDLESNQLFGTIPPELGNLSNLKYLWFYGNQLSGSIPPELGNLSNLIDADLDYNQLSGSIPPELGNLSNLERLDLDYNQLSGSIPAELGNLSRLNGLYLIGNQLSGSIPPELGNLSGLGGLDLSYNQLSGSIPPELGNLSGLGGLDLSYNQLSGNIPPELGNLNNLEDLDLSSNQLIGNIPTSLLNLSYLWWIDISGNCLYTNDPDLRAWLANFDPDWESYQCEGEKDPPFGAFETPVDGSTVCSSIAVTGWALDDFAVDNVKIYREQGNNLVYIGDATFVEGARPDIAGNYPNYPNNTRAGWGYMMLTNFLPNSGNGTFVLHAIATDASGKTTTLGTKTIHCDNANAVKPFGAIDTPTPGGDASGNAYRNVGWVLTPLPNKVPADGSTIHVYVDGVKLGGHATYNIYRLDIAALFPGYANSSGAQAYYDIDTTPYTNGLHQVFWIVTDNAGNADGIGSRYFSIQNANPRGVSMHNTGAVSDISNIPIDYSIPARVKKGFNEDDEPMDVLSDAKGINRVFIKELERIEIYLSLSDQPPTGHSYSGYMVVDNRLELLPVGSTLDHQKGIFYWQPGPGFIGEYRFVFIEKGQDMDMNRKNVIVKIGPRFE